MIACGKDLLYFRDISNTLEGSEPVGRDQTTLRDNDPWEGRASAPMRWLAIAVVVKND